MKPDSRVLLFKHDNAVYVLDYVPIDPSLGGNCSLDEFFADHAPHGLDLGFDTEIVPQGISIFEGCFEVRAGAMKPIICAYGMYRGLTPREAAQVAKACATFAFPGANDTLLDIDSFLAAPAWLETMVTADADPRKLPN